VTAAPSPIVCPARRLDRPSSRPTCRWTSCSSGFPITGRHLVLHRGIPIPRRRVVEIVALTLLWRRLASLRPRTAPRGNGAVCMATALLSHLYMGLAGSYGWRPFLPWNGRGITSTVRSSIRFSGSSAGRLAWGANGTDTACGALVSAARSRSSCCVPAISSPAWLLVVYGIICVIAAMDGFATVRTGGPATAAAFP